MNAHVEPMGQPAPGSAKVGNLYADLQTRTLWLGVDLAVDATGSVLISDMLQSLAAIELGIDESKAYTDQKLLLYAPLANPVFTGNPRAPTVAAADSDTTIATTAFVHAAITADQSNKLNIGSIILYSGPVNSVGTGIWANWHLCDGGGGTPDLRDRFVVGAGNLASKVVNSKARATTNESPMAGSHTHPISAEALTIAQLPSHAHGSGTLAGILTGSSGLGGTHAHILTCCSVVDATKTVFRPLLQRAGNAVNASTDTEPNHSHSAGYVVDVNTGSSANAGSGGTHTHTTTSRGEHQHSITSAELRDAIPYMAICYIMKIS